MKSNYSYFIYLIRRFQDNNNDIFTILSSDKGSGKSSLAMHLARDYIRKFGFICPKCGNEFYKNIYQSRKEGNSMIFYIPEAVKRDEVYIECPEVFELNLRTGAKEKLSGCGHMFPYSQRKYVQWDADKYIAYDNVDARKKILSMPRYSPLIFDEAMNFLSGESHNKAESKEMKKLFTVIRPRRLFMMACIPELMWVDSKYREIMSHFWIYCINKGIAFVFEKDKAVTKDKWHLKELSKTLGTIKYFTSIEKIKRNIRKHPCYFDTITWGELPEKVYNEYEFVRNAHNLQRQIEEMEISNNDIAKIMSYNLMYNYDRIHQEIVKSPKNSVTYNILRNEILLNPITKKPMASETTIRNWIIGVENYIKTKGKNTAFLQN